MTPAFKSFFSNPFDIFFTFDTAHNRGCVLTPYLIEVISFYTFFAFFFVNHNGL